MPNAGATAAGGESIVVVIIIMDIVPPEPAAGWLPLSRTEKRVNRSRTNKEAFAWFCVTRRDTVRGWLLAVVSGWRNDDDDGTRPDQIMRWNVNPKTRMLLSQALRMPY